VFQKSRRLLRSSKAWAERFDGNEARQVFTCNLDQAHVSGRCATNGKLEKPVIPAKAGIQRFDFAGFPLSRGTTNQAYFEVP
jgi:hypothetical protein